jgi:hypothetical protein
LADSTINNMQRHAENELLNKITGIEEGFQALSVVNTSNVPESIFIRDFLPLFSGEIKDIEQMNYLLSMWYLIAGTPYNVVNVVGKNGKFIIAVPPVLDRSIIANKSSQYALDAIFEEAKQKSVLSPNLGQKIINDELNDRFLNESKNEASSELTAQWITLLTYYGKVKKVTTTKINANEEDGFSYD